MSLLPTWLNPFDVLIAFAMVVGIAMGFIRGLLRMATSIVIVYIAAVLSVSFYATVGRWIRYLSAGHISEAVADVLGFLLILAITVAILQFLMKRTYKDTEWPGIRQVDQLGGMVLGFLLVSLWIGLVLAGISFLLGVAHMGSMAFRENMLFHFRKSILVPIFYRFLPLAFATLRPWLPKGQLPEILTFRVF